jgi:hypothetical protein
MKSEYKAASAAAQEAIWLNRLLEEMGFRSKKPIILYEDNKAAILFSDHPGDHRRSKHIDTRKYLLRDAVFNGEIKLEYINTFEQLAMYVILCCVMQICLCSVMYVFPCYVMYVFYVVSHMYSCVVSNMYSYVLSCMYSSCVVS